MNINKLIEEYPWNVKTIRCKGTTYTAVDWVKLCIEYDTSVALGEFLGCSKTTIARHINCFFELRGGKLSTKFFNILGVKKCAKCKNIKKPNEFAQDLHESSSLSYSCKECQNVRNKKYRDSERGEVITKAYRKYYYESDHGKAVQRAYKKSDHGKAVQRAYKESGQGKAIQRAWRQSEHGKAVQKAYQESDHGKAVQKAYKESDHGKATRKAWQQSEGGRASLNANSAKRRAAKLKRTPIWADLEAIKQVYMGCPKGYHVDHIIPLQGEKVSGLHVHNNLQYLIAVENFSKGNTYNIEEFR